MGNVVNSNSKLTKNIIQQNSKIKSNHTSYLVSSVDYPRDKTIISQLNEVTRKYPERIGFVFESESLTFQELNKQANELASFLINKGISTGSLVPFCMEKSLEMLVTIFGILKSGAAYVPIDPNFPIDRIQYILEDIKASVLLVNSDLDESLTVSEEIELMNFSSIPKDQVSEPTITFQPSPENLAYVIYTSGSTGNPKGVMVPHKGLMDHCFGLIESAKLKDCESYAITAPIVFDAGHSLIHTSIIQAATFHFISDTVLLDSERFTAYLTNQKIDCLKIVPSLWLSHTEGGFIPVPEKKLIFGGENFPLSILAFLNKIDFKGDVFNHYGPTEASIGKCIHQLDLSRKYNQVPIGKPFSNSFILILNSKLEMVTEDEVGEIYIGGEGIARGYLNLPMATAKSFIPDFISGLNGGVLYRTGDLGKTSEDGNILYHGRIDDQIKINGYRIEPGEIETCIYQFESIKQVTVVAKSNKSDKSYLVAYYVLERSTLEDNIKEKLKSKLPAYMIPKYWVNMETMPLTSNGKIDKQSLPDPEWKATISSTTSFPKTETEKCLLAIWRKVLGWKQIGTDDNFFELGGDSLLAIRSISAIKQELGKRLLVKDFFDSPTISSLSQKIDKTDIDLQVLAATENAGSPPLSFNQEAMWIIHNSRGSLQYHLPMVFSINGELDVKSLKAAFKEIVKRHLPLQTIFTATDEGLVQEQLGSDSWLLQEFITPQTENEVFRDWPFKSMIAQPFDLSSDYMIRAAIFQIEPQKHILGIVVHHIAWDGWSTALFKNNLSNLYNLIKNGKPVPKQANALAYTDFSLHQRSLLKGDFLNNSLQYWNKKLTGVLPSQLRTDSSRTSEVTSSGSSQEFIIDKETHSKLKSLAKKHNATLFMVLLAGFKALLKRHSNQEDICVGIPMAGREHNGMEDLIGFFVNTLPIRTLVDGNSDFNDLLKNVKNNTLEALEHGHVPFGEIVKLSDDFRFSDRNPVFQVLFVMQSNSATELNFDDLEITPLKVTKQTSEFELILEVKESEELLTGQFEFQTAIFNPSTIALISDHYIELLKSITIDSQDSIDGINLLNEKEKDFVLNKHNDFVLPKELSHSTFLSLFEDQVKLVPNKTAIDFNGDSNSFTDLDLKSNLLANHLINIGVKRGTYIPICLDNSPQMIIGILGILKAGAAYVPLNPDFPKERIQFILEDTKASWVITDEETENIFRENFTSISIISLDSKLSSINKGNPEKPALPLSTEDPAYLIYTSGTTGKPKGVIISHRGLFLFLFSRERYYPESYPTLLLMSFTFDGSIPAIFGTLARGNALILGKANQLKDTKELKKLIRLTGTIHCVPSFYHFLLTENLIPTGQIKRVILGGEKIDSSLLALHFEKNKEAKLYNEYGPTEATVWVTVAELKTPKTRITIGKPIAHINIYILDHLGKVCPVGIPGELFISSESLAKGYLNRPELTALNFVPDPFSNVKDRKMYKTGDQAILLQDGNIELLGRLDNQVKLRGYRIELEEIEKVLNTLDLVDISVVTLNGKTPENQVLVGHIITVNNLKYLSEEQKTERLIAHLSDNLPSYMIPSQWHFINSVPLTTNGKINRKKLSQIDLSAKFNKVLTQSKNPTEIRLQEIWEELLNIKQVGINDNFFKIGGHSLMAIRLINAIKTHFNFEIKFTEIFKQPTIHQQALLIGGISSTLPRQQNIEIPIEPKEFPLSFNQESLWLTDKLEGSLHYHIPLVLKLTGKLDSLSMESTLRKILDRHEILRSVYQYDGDHIYQVVRKIENWQLEVKDISTEVWDEQTLSNFIQLQINQPFDLRQDLMFRALLIRQSNEVSILALAFHHIAFDGWSVGILMNEIEYFYSRIKNNSPLDKQPLPIQYRNYAIWQRNQFQSYGFEENIAYWKNKLAALQPISLAQHKNVIDDPNSDCDTIFFLIPAHHSKHLKELASKSETTLYMVLMATFKTLLYQLTHQTDICVGTVVADRNYQHTDKLLGYFVNTLPIRSHLNPSGNFSDFLNEVKDNCLEAFEFQEIPFEKIVVAAQPERILGSNPLFQVMFLLQNSFDKNGWKIDDLIIEQLKTKPQRAKFDLMLTSTEVENGIEGVMEYKTSLFNSEEVNQIIEKYLDLLETIFAQPSLPIDAYTEDKKAKINSIQEELKPDTYNEFRPVQELIESAVHQYPAKTAIISKNESCSYKVLNETSNQLADLLIQKGIGRNDIVGIVMDRSIEMITSIMAVLKAGAAYLPVDTDFPDERISYMLKDAAKVHITHNKYKGKFKSQSIEILWEEFKAKQDNFSKENPSPNNEANDVAYIIYTSGSTGKPKGVMLTHGNLYNFLKTVSHKPGITAKNKFLAVSSASFDIALLELILPFVHGAQIVILDQFERKDPRLISDYLRQKKADIMFATPTHWKMLLESGWNSRVDNLQIISGGEALSKELAKQLLPLCHSLWNIYGPTETTVFSTIKKIEADQSLITIGREVLNTKIYLLDENQKPVQKGKEGEIYISGKGVAKGYLNQPELTNQKFSTDPFQSQLGICMYKTGDRAKFLPDGEMQILGRIDNQIKLRGHRIELEEIEQAINELASVKESVVLFRNTSRNDKGLVAYLLLKENLEESEVTDKTKVVSAKQVKGWKKELSLTLPGYMLPYDYVIVDHFPHTASGKIDRLRLPDPIAIDQEVILLPETLEEKKIAAIWSVALGLDKIDITDNFFEIGGHSLIAVKVMTLIEKELGTRLPLSILFKYPTIQKLGSFLESKVELNKEWKSIVPIQPSGSRPPIYLVHGAGLNVMPFHSLAKYLVKNQPLYGIQSKGMNEENTKYESIEEIARNYIEELKENSPSGEIILGGYSLGGIIAFEMAKQLKNSSITVKKLILFDSYATFIKDPHSPKNKLLAKIHLQLYKKSHDLKLLVTHPSVLKDIKYKSISKKLNGLFIKLKLKTKKSESPILQRINKIKALHLAACKNYTPGFYEGEITLFRAKIRTNYFFEPEFLGWKAFSRSINIIEVEGTHTGLFIEPNDKKIATIIKQVVE
ncbi:non-ribosomal peptide synthetase [Cyclobacterium amurskyense]|uniref:Long-chain-fatty-acid--CoA ligase n=1 Tax=Cyclobacterium amurskyense TaxID=320787 RepID=A0A0H4PH16_9BACT|nr:non-ribosomal peptide synthetase [Cyclobacterium amurskyense]AKP53836.1 Long-chain-fatty-acid--CoA ligase [Cyclobacterium amurskyense]